MITEAPTLVPTDARAAVEEGVPTLELDSVTRTYGSDPPVRALQGVSFSIHAGELLAIVGPSGSGKSTLLHLMGTLERPSSGRVSVTGLDVAQLSDRELAAVRATRIGFVFQQFFLAEHSTALELVGRPAIVLADEPTGNLDSVNGQAIIDLIDELNAEGATIVVITHEHEIAARFPRRIVLLDGRIVSDHNEADATAEGEATR
jgi:putative ABC transport system ATP-binding protein